MRISLALTAAILLTTVAACKDERTAALPAPEILTREASGYYCGMIIADHPGPKAQLFLRGEGKAVWFSSVRDAVAFTMLPEEASNIAVLYVSDMTDFQDWDHPPAAWVPIETAHFVIGSSMRGGMGAMEVVSFGTAEAARAFAGNYGGEVVRFKDIPTDYVLGSDTDKDAAKG